MMEDAKAGDGKPPNPNVMDPAPPGGTDGDDNGFRDVSDGPGDAGAALFEALSGGADPAVVPGPEVRAPSVM